MVVEAVYFFEKDSRGIMNSSLSPILPLAIHPIGPNSGSIKGYPELSWALFWVGSGWLRVLLGSCDPRYFGFVSL